MFYLGIDQHASQLTISLRDEHGNVEWRRQVSTKPEKILEFFEPITRRCREANCGFWAIVEVCGFNDWLLEMLKNFRCQRIVLVQPEKSQGVEKPIGVMRPNSVNNSGCSGIESPLANRSTNSKSSVSPIPFSSNNVA